MYSVVVLLALANAADMSGCHRHRGRCCYCYAPAGCCWSYPPASYGAGDGSATDGSTGNADTGTGPEPPAATGPRWSSSDTSKIRAALIKDAGLSEADADEVISAAKDAKEEPKGLLEVIDDPIKKYKKKGAAAKKSLLDYLMQIKKATGETSALPVPAPATLVVSLPGDAKLTVEGDTKLTVEGNPTVSTFELRRFVSPVLKPGTTYLYTLRAEVRRDNVVRVVKKDVSVRAGQETRVTIEPLADALTLTQR